MSVEDSTARNTALTLLFSDWIKSDIASLNAMLEGWRRDDARWTRILPALTHVLPPLSERIGKDPALVHLLTLTSAAYARLSPGEAVNWARTSFGRAGEDVALSVIVEEVAIVSPEKATRLTGDISDSVIRLDALCGIARTLAATKGDAAFSWVQTLPVENREDVSKAALDAWAQANPGMALAHALHNNVPGGVQIVFVRWATDQPDKAAVAARSLADSRVRSIATAAVVDAVEAKLPVGEAVCDWTAALPRGVGRDAVNALLAGSQAEIDPSQAWQITGAIEDVRTRGEARRAVVVKVAASNPETARKLIDDDQKLAASEAAELRGLIAGQPAGGAAANQP